MKKAQLNPKPISTKISKSYALKKEFSYVKGACSLNFTLNPEDTMNLLDFKACLLEAILDIDKHLPPVKRDLN